MLIDVTRLADRMLRGKLPTGVDRVSLAYIDHIGQQARALIRFAGRWVELGHTDSQRVFRALQNGRLDDAAMIRWCVVRAYAFSWPRHRGTLLMNTGHSGLERPAYVHEIRRRDLRPVFFLHDLIPISHPEYCRPGEADKHHSRLNTMLSVGQGMIVNSGETLDKLQAYAGKCGMVLPPCAVAPLAPARLPEPSCGRPLEKPYFVVLGTIEPRKNHLLLLHLWRQLITEMGEAAPRLVIIGQRGWECEQVVDLLDRCVALNGFVIESSCCSDGELATWLRHASALLFPSFAEGFGIPLIEALMLGTPVIASDLSVFHEIAKDIPEYCDPLDGVGWRQRILAYMDPLDPQRLAQVARMNNFQASTWAEHFDIVDSLLASIAPDARFQ